MQGLPIKSDEESSLVAGVGLIIENPRFFYF